jgi:enoyl-[acyl-carrier protein] reductase/trans-2-enoyl-CoA reductase (NAD+)
MQKIIQKKMSKENFMIIEPKVRGFICTTAHPVGCAKNVEQQIHYLEQQAQITGPQKVLVIGASTGYGLSSRITATFACGASTVGVMYERESLNGKPASPGWYNTAAFEQKAHNAGYYAKTVNGDAFSDEIKQQTIELIKKDLGQVDLVIYSLASPRRVSSQNW